MTFSIVAFDPANGDLGVAVQSKFPSVGVSIPFAKAGVGALATQCYCNTSYGPRGLALLENGASPEQAVAILIGSDAQRDYRQLGIIDAQGRVASCTGALNLSTQRQERNESIGHSSTKRSARSFKVHRWWPTGGRHKAKATRRAACLPVKALNRHHPIRIFRTRPATAHAAMT